MRPLDLDPESRRALEFDALLQAASGYARTEFGAARVRSLAPASDLGTVRDRLAIVDEMLRCVRRDGRLLSGFVPDPRPALETLAIAGGCPEPTALRDLAAVLAASGGLRKSLGALERDLHPRLRELAGLLPRLDDEAEEILGNIEPDGSLADGASRELRRLRRAMGAVGERLRRMLEGFLRRPEYGSALQDDFVTQRNGRYVLPVRTDAGTAVRGIVHASSSSQSSSRWR